VNSPLKCPFPKSDYDVKGSYSRMLQHGRCPHLFWNKYRPDKENRVPGVTSVPMVRGRVVHATANQVAKVCIKRNVDGIDPDEAWGIFGDCVVDERASPEVTAESSKIVAEFLSSHHGFAVDDPDVITETETVIWWIVSDEHVRVAMVAKIDFCRYDLTTGEAVIVDYKTSPRVPKTAELERGNQLPIYADALLHKHPELKKVNGAFDFVAKDHQTQERDLLPDVPRARKWVLHVARQIHAGFAAVKTGKDPEGVFPAEPGDACYAYGMICPLVFVCPYRKRLELPVTDETSDEEMLERIVYRDALQRAEKAAFKQRTAGRVKAVTAGGKTASHELVKDTDYHFDRLKGLEWLLAKGYTNEELALRLKLDGLHNQDILDELIQYGAARVTSHTTLVIGKAKKQ